MSVTDHDRRILFDRLLDVLGPAGADTMMELLPPVGWADVARRGDLAVVRGELRGEMAELRGEMAELRGEMAELRGEMAELRAEVRGLVPKMVVANLVSMIGLSGVLLGAQAVGG